MDKFDSYSEYLKQFKTEVSKEVDIDTDAQDSPDRILPASRTRNSVKDYLKNKKKKK